LEVQQGRDCINKALELNWEIKKKYRILFIPLTSAK